ncbi:phage/plasmid primase, P4 family [Halobacteriales archaeon Cl-PHB]
MTAESTWTALQEFLWRRPDATPAEALGAALADPGEWYDAVAAALDTDNPAAALERRSPAPNPGSNTAKPVSKSPERGETGEPADAAAGGGTDVPTYTEEAVANIPAELQERDQWLMFDTANNSPRRPHWGGDFQGTSWNDPADWHSFDEAVEMAATVPTWGIGYVFAYANDDYPRGLYGCLDIDGCYDENGQAADWVPSLSPIFDAGGYVERSPSGNGLHIPLVGFEPPAWWADVHFDESDHEGVEAYGSKFVTFTGDQLDGSGDIVAEVNMSGWLADAYETITGETPTTSTGGDYDGDLDADLRIHDVVSVSQYPRGENTAHPFHPSGTGTNFRVDEDAETFRCWRHDVTGNAAHLLGMEQGIIDCGDWTTGLDDATWREIFDAGRDAGYDIPEPDPAAAVDGGTAAVTPPTPTTPDGEPDLAAAPNPGAVLAVAGTGDDDVTDLDDRGKADAVWQILDDRDDAHYRHSEDGTIWAYDDGVWTRDGERLLGYDAKNWLTGAAYGENVKRELVTQVEGDDTTFVPADEWGAPDGTVATAGGLLDLRDENCPTEPLQPDHLALHKLPVEPDPDADAPEFEAFVADSVPDPTDRAKLQEYAGYVLWHHAQPLGKALFLLGPTDSGKGTFLRILKGVLGGGDAPLASESLRDLTASRWGSARLYTNWANVRNEVTPGDLRNVERFKEFTGGGDRVSAEFKGQDKFEFDVTQKFVFAMNQMPTIENTDRAFWNRILPVEFPNTVPADEQDHGLADRIVADEAAGVLNWLLDGLRRLFAQMQFTGERDISEKRKVCGAYGDAFDRFCEDVLTVTGDDADAVVKGDLVDLAGAYADDLGMDRSWNTQSGFTRQLKALGADDMETRSLTPDEDKHNVYLGVRADQDVLDRLGVDVRQGNIYGADGHRDSGQQDTLT